MRPSKTESSAAHVRRDPSPESRPPLVLASASPRRHRLLREAGVDFEVQPADIDERPRPDETPAALVERLAREKSLAVARRLGAEGQRSRIVLGADTIVAIDGDVLGKPMDAEHAFHLLRRIIGRTHRVLTGVALARMGAGGPVAIESVAVESEVEMRTASDAELRAYIAGGEPMDKAGAYALQGEGRRFVLAVHGSETNVIGLPVEETLALLARHPDGSRP